MIVHYFDILGVPRHATFGLATFVSVDDFLSIDKRHTTDIILWHDPVV